MKRTVIWALVGLALGGVVWSGGNREKRFQILYTASLNGNLDGCTCKSQPRAGLVTRAHFLRTHFMRTRAAEDTVLVDAGDILDVAADDLLAAEILDAYWELGYDAVAVGDQEFSNGLEMLIAYRDRYPLFAHNLALCPTEDRCLFFSTAPLILTRGGLQIGIFALTTEAVFRFADEAVKEGVKISSAQLAAEGMLERFVEDEVAVSVLLFHGHLEDARVLAEQVPGIDVIVVGHEQQLLEAERLGATVIVSPGEEGNRIGILTVSVAEDGTKRFKNDFKHFDYEGDPHDQALRQRIAHYQTQLKARLKARADP